MDEGLRARRGGISAESHNYAKGRRVVGITGLRSLDLRLETEACSPKLLESREEEFGAKLEKSKAEVQSQERVFKSETRSGISLQQTL